MKRFILTDTEVDHILLLMRNGLMKLQDNKDRKHFREYLQTYDIVNELALTQEPIA